MDRDSDAVRALRAALARTDPPGPAAARQADLGALGPDTARWLREVIESLEAARQRARRFRPGSVVV